MPRHLRMRISAGIIMLILVIIAACTSSGDVKTLGSNQAFVPYGSRLVIYSGKNQVTIVPHKDSVRVTSVFTQNFPICPEIGCQTSVMFSFLYTMTVIQADGGVVIEFPPFWTRI